MRLQFQAMVIAAAILTVGTAHAYEIDNCDPTARADIKLAADFLEANMSTLVDRYTFLSEKQRQEIIRKWARLHIRCSDNVNECTSAFGYSHGGPGNGIRICYYTMVQSKVSLCDLTNTIMHEQGHAHGFREVPGHNNPTQYIFDNDPMYRMGAIAQNFCESRASSGAFTDAALQGRIRALGAACTADEQCASHSCSHGTCQCNQNADCPGGQSCLKPVSGRNFCSSTSLPIGASCTRDDQCRSDHCERGSCVCRHDGDCASGQVCRTPITGPNFCQAQSNSGSRPVGSPCQHNAEC